MTAHIQQSHVADTLENVLRAELSASGNDVLKRNWSMYDIQACHNAITREEMGQVFCVHARKDSVKSEDEMRVVYPVAGKATDVTTLMSNGDLGLTECKYGIMLGGSGPFSSKEAFRKFISEKFYSMERQLVVDGETLCPLRVLVVTADQLPTSIMRVQSLMLMNEPIGSFAPDGKQHDYVLCATNSVRMMLTNPPKGVANSQEFLFFTL